MAQLPFDVAIGFLTEGVLLATAIATLVGFIVHRDRERAVIAAMFGSLGFGTLVSWASDVTGSELPRLEQLSTVLLLGHALFMTLVLERFRSVPRWIVIVLGTAWPISAALYLLAPGPDLDGLSPLALAFILGSFLLGELYAAYGMVAGAVASRGRKKRLVLAATGTGLLALVLAIAISEQTFAADWPAVDVAVGLLALAAVLSFFLGFSPPAWLRRIWRQQAVASFASQQAAAHTTAERASRSTAALIDVGLALARVRQAWVALGPRSHWRLVGGRQDATKAELQVSLADSAKLSVWVDEDLPYRLTPVGQVSLEANVTPEGSQSLLSIPMRSDRRPWGLFMLALERPPLFLQETVATMHLLATQACTAYEAEEAEAEIRAANAELGAFAYSVSHDLRAPLRAMDGFSRILQLEHANDLSTEARHDVAMIVDAAREMGQMVDDLLRLSRLGKQAINAQTVDAKAMVEGVVAELAAQEKDRDLDIQVGPMPSSQADPGLLKQVWVNLIGNAVKYTRKREHAHVEIGWTTDHGGAYFVKDNGVGFDMRHAHNLFGVFQRLNRAEEYEGTGVGLAIVRRIVQRHGGEVWAEAEADKGSTFYFNLKGRTVNP